jgi:hypothetical protein
VLPNSPFVSRDLSPTISEKSNYVSEALNVNTA